MSSFYTGINGHDVIPGMHTAGGGMTNFNIHYPPSQGEPRLADRSTRPRESFSTVPFASDPDFVDRPEILAWVHDKCAGRGARAALVGLGGVGYVDVDPRTTQTLTSTGSHSSPSSMPTMSAMQHRAPSSSGCTLAPAPALKKHIEALPTG